MSFLSNLTNLLCEILASNQRLESKLDQLLAELRPGSAVTFAVKVKDPITGEIKEYEGDFSMIQNRHTTRHVKLVPKDADGNVTTLDGPVIVTSNNPAVTIANKTDDGLEFDMVTDALAGIGPVSLSGDADRTEGVKDIAGNIDVQVPAGDAVTFDPEIGEEVANS